MNIIGDLERTFARLVYPNRVPIAVAIVLVLVITGYVAWKGGWLASARRRPLRVAAVAVPILALVAPLGWYLGSPLVVSSVVDEPAPVAAARAVEPAVESPPARPTAGSRPSPSGPPAATPRSTARPSAAAPTPAPSAVARTGAFSGADEFHFGRGTARLIETASGRFVVRLESFEVRNGPDLFVYLSPSATGYDEGAVELGRLKADRGNQNYEIPDGIDPSAFRSVVIWCRQFSVLFATAPLS